MLTYKVLPDHIKKVAEEYNHSNERLDCLPSKLQVGNKSYYVVHYYPTLNDLFICEDGSVPAFEEVKRSILIVKVYQTAGNSLMNIGGKWLKAPTSKLYRKLEQKLTTIKKKVYDSISIEDLTKLEKIIIASRKMKEDQDLIFNCVDKGTELIVKANETEIVTEEIQKEVRKYVEEMVRAAVRQNQAQLDTERERRELLSYLGSVIFKKPSILLEYLWFKKNEPYMLNSNSPTAKEMGELREMVKEDKTIDNMENADEMIALLRNPR